MMSTNRFRRVVMWAVGAISVGAAAGMVGVDPVGGVGDPAAVGPAGVRRAAEGLGLGEDQQRQVRPILETYMARERQAREELLAKLKGVLTPRQMAAFTGSFGVARVASAGGGNPSGSTTSQVAVSFSGGFETDPRDGGRPVVLVAGELEVTPDVFRKAFGGVTPAAGGRQPEAGQVRRNKEALLRVLAPYGVTNDRLDEVSDYYRYQPGRGNLWRHAAAQAVANVRDGVVTGFTITNRGSGYSSPPEVTVVGMPGVKAEVKLAFGPDFRSNGSVREIVIITAK